MKQPVFSPFIIAYFCVMSLFLPAAYAHPSVTPDTVDETTAETQNKGAKPMEQPWAILGYWGRMTNDDMGDVIFFNNYSFNEETLYSLEFTHVLPPTNPIRRFLQPVLSTLEVNMNFTYRDDPLGPIYEFNPYFSVRWGNAPWDKYLVTTFAIGEGISYATRVPTVELNDRGDQRPWFAGNGNSRKLLNFLMAEFTFALPAYPNLELVARMHHRSGVFGAYNAGNSSGSTAVGLGVRYRF